MARRTVTMADYEAFKAAALRLEHGTAEGVKLALDGMKIVTTAEEQGQEPWAQKFSADTLKSLQRLKSELENDCIKAAENFTGERRAPWETFATYWARIHAAIADPTWQTLYRMMVRNGVTFIWE